MSTAPLPSNATTRRRLGYVARLVRPQLREFLLSSFAAIVATACAAAVPFLLKHALDKGFGRTGGQPGDVNFGELHRWLAVIAVVTVVCWLANVAHNWWAVWSVRVVNDLRTRLYEHIQKQGLDFFSKNRTGTIISRLTNDVEALAQLVTEGVFMVFVNLFYLVLIESFLFALDVRLALAVNVIFVVMMVATAIFRYYSSRAYRLTRERMAHVTAFLAESLGGMRVLQSFAAEERAAMEFEETNSDYRKANMDTVYQSAFYFSGVELLAAVGTGIVLWYGGILGRDDAIAVSVIIAFILYLENFFDPIQQLSQFYGTFLSAMAALDKIMEVMETEPTIVDREGALALENVRGAVEFKDVSFSYSESGPTVLSGVALTIEAGTSVALVGRTGAGKSTFVKLLSRFYDPSVGTVTLDGHDLRDLQQRWLRRSMGLVPQEGFLFAGTIRENIAYAKPDASHAAIEQVAQAVGADEFIENLPDGYDTDVGERGGRLSAGQRQLIAYARALLADPPLLVLDEATSSVDVATELRLSAGLRTLVAGRTAFIVAHRLSTIRQADRILVIHDGRVVEDGSHDQLLSQKGFYSDLYTAWNKA